MILGSLRGIYILTPRNMTQAAGMYNTMLASDDPRPLIIECLNGYRLREKLPSNLIDFKVPIGKIEVLKEVQILPLLLMDQIVELQWMLLLNLKSSELVVRLLMFKV